MSCFDRNMQKQIENKANTSKIIRYARGLFLTWMRKLKNYTYIVCTVTVFCTNRYLATF